MLMWFDRIIAVVLRVLAVIGLAAGVAGTYVSLTRGPCERTFPPTASEGLPYAGGQNVEVSCGLINDRELAEVLDVRPNSAGLPDHYLSLEDTWFVQVRPDWTTRAGHAALWSISGVALLAGCTLAARRLGPAKSLSTTADHTGESDYDS